jgi:hypothetical protein
MQKLIPLKVKVRMNSDELKDEFEEDEKAKQEDFFLHG